MADETHVDTSNQPAADVSGEIAGDIQRAVRQAFPWLQLTRAPGMSFDLNKMVLSLAGVFLIQVVWAALDAALLDVETSRLSATSAIRSRWGEPWPWLLSSWISGPVERLTEPLRVLTTPLLTFVSVNPFDRLGLHAGLTGLATIAVWGLFGGAVARVSLVQLGWRRGLGIKPAFEYAATHLRPSVATPTLAFVVLLLAGLVAAVYGLIFKLPWIGNFFGGILMILPIGLGLLMFLLVAGLAVGWPLMVVSVAAEGEDELDALSRSFSYLNNRLGRYAFYLVLALLIGIPASWLVELISEGTLLMTQWGLGLTVPQESLNSIFSPETPQVVLSAPGDPVVTLPEASWTWFLPSFWIGFVRLAARAWAFSYFWSSMSIIYLLLRKDVDGAESAQLKPDAIGDDSEVEDSPAPVNPAKPPRETPVERSAIPLADEPE